MKRFLLGILIGWFSSLIPLLLMIDGVQARERGALIQGLTESTPGDGWRVVFRTPALKTEQVICTDPRTERETRVVVCLGWAEGLLGGGLHQVAPTEVALRGGGAQ